jgi:hypothetical protein
MHKRASLVCQFIANRWEMLEAFRMGVGQKRRRRPSARSQNLRVLEQSGKFLKDSHLPYGVIAKIPPGWYFLARKYRNTTPFGPHPVVLPT